MDDEFSCESLIDFNMFEVAKKESFNVLIVALEHLELYHFDINSTDENGNTLLHICAAKGNLECTKKIISIGGCINLLNKKMETPLLLACRHKSTKLAEILLKEKASVNIPDLLGETPIFLAVRTKNLKLVEILHQNGAVLTKLNKINQSLLHVCDYLSIVEYLVKNGLDINKPSADGSIPIQASIHFGEVEIIKCLIEKGANIHILDNKKRNLLHLAILADFYDIAEFLIFKNININAGDEEGSTPLHYAVDTSQRSILSLLLKYKADVNKADIDDYTPLHVAATKNNEDILHLLIKHEAKQLKTFNDDLPLHLACSTGNIPAIFHLYNDDDFQVKNRDGKTPQDLAYEYNKDLKTWFVDIQKGISSA